MTHKNDFQIIKEHYGNPHPCWIDTPDENGVFGWANLDDATRIAVSVVDGAVVEGKIIGEGSYTGDMTTDTQYIVYI